MSLLLLLFGSLAAVLLAGLLYQGLGSYRDHRRVPPLGRLIDVGDRRLHLYDQGNGSPAVILEAGIAGTSLGWALVQPRIAEFTRVCSYDRAGLGWSDAAGSLPSVSDAIADLRNLLSRAGVPPPYVLVGHSFGGLLVRAYAHHRPDQVAGLVLVDPVSVAYWSDCPARERARLRLGTGFSRRGAWLARFGVVRLALAGLLGGGRTFPKLIARASAGRGQGTLERLVGEVQKLPREVWPFVASHWSNPKCFRAMAAALESLPANAREALSITVPQHIPVVVLSAVNSTKLELDERDRWVRESQRGLHIHLERSGHWIQLEQPEAVVEAVRDLVRSL
ncbi:MAG TPA: alpha/beta hydrolase [Bryobacteraceae bacterium]